MRGRTTRCGRTGCLLWNAAVDTYGYGHARWGGVRLKSHVMALRIEGIDIPAGMVVRHVCNNTRCCNPQHLELGTPAENMADKARSGVVAGERSPQAKLTNRQAKAIYRLKGRKPAASVASRFATTAATVWRIWNGQAYSIATKSKATKRGRLRGQVNPAAKITDEQAVAIYAMKGAIPSAAAAARQARVPVSVVRKLWRGETYSHVTGAENRARRRPRKVITCVQCSVVIQDAGGNRKYCSLSCALAAQVATRGPNDCWLWAARSKSRGYGQVSFCGQRFFAHQVAFDLAFPRLAARRKSKQLTVSHRCHEPLCCNPAHLEVLTLRENINRNRGRKDMSGERNHQAKISAEVAGRIHELIAEGEKSTRILARVAAEKGVVVSLTQVTDIRRGRTWANLRRNGDASV